MIRHVVRVILRFDRSLHEFVDYRPWVPLRIVAGPIVIVHLWPILTASLHGATHHDAFVSPYWDWYPHLAEPVYLVALWTAAAGAVLMSVGFLTRPATVATAVFVGYHLFLSRTHYHHNRAFLLMVLVALALVPVGRVVSLDALRSGRRGAPSAARGRRWPLTLLRFQVAAVYVASGVAKLLDPDWLGGTVTRLRVEAGIPASIPEPLAGLATAEWFHAGLAPAVVLTEIVIGVGLLTPRLRPAAVWLALTFHAAIEATADVEVFSLVSVAALVIWVAPTSHDRLVRLPRGWRETAVRLLDWTGRFRVAREQASGGLMVLDRDGAARTGRDAELLLLTRLPLTFWFAAPLSLIVGAVQPSPRPRRA